MDEVATDEGQKFYIGNIPYQTTDQDLITFFAEKGVEVSKVELITDRENNDRPKGFGFAWVPVDQVEKMKEQNGQEIDGRPLKIDLARPKEERPRNNFRSQGNDRGYSQRSYR